MNEVYLVFFNGDLCMLSYKNISLKYKKLWLMIGFFMISFVVYSSLTSQPVTSDIEFSDKFFHIVGYFGLMGWFMQIYRDRKDCVVLAAGFIAMGIGLEFLQDIGGVRYFEINDMYANTFGVLLALSLFKTPFSAVLEGIEKLISR